MPSPAPLCPRAARDNPSLRGQATKAKQGVVIKQDMMKNKFTAPAAGKAKPFSRKARPGKPFGKKEFGDKPFSGRGDKPFSRDERRPAPRFSGGKTAEHEEKSERIAKRLARAGVASRREAETMIAAGRIAVNGRVLDTPAVNVGRADKITVDGAALPVKERTRLWLYHKPAGLITTARDEQGRPTIFDSLPAALPRVVSVGRLDMNTEGLLLLTNDGGLARILELPSTGWVRHYRVRVHGKVSQAQLDSLKTGIAVDGVFYGGAEAVLEREQGSNAWLSISLREGKNREIKNILGALGLTVTRLIRTSFGPFRLADLDSGMVLEVRGRTLRDQLGENLAQEAELDFDAPIIAPFPNAPVAAKPLRNFAQTDEERADFAPRSAGCREEGWISSSRGGRPPQQNSAAPMPRRATRSANVWHAPGSKARAVKQNDFDRGANAERGYGRDNYNKDGGGERRERPFRREERGGEYGGGRERRFDRPRGERKSFAAGPGRGRDFGPQRESGAERAERGFAGKKPYPARQGDERRKFNREEDGRKNFAGKAGEFKPRNSKPGGFKQDSGRPNSFKSAAYKPRGTKPAGFKPRGS